MHACIHAYQVVVVLVSHEQHAYALGVVERLRLALPHLQVSLSISFSPSLQSSSPLSCTLLAPCLSLNLLDTS